MGGRVNLRNVLLIFVGLLLAGTLGYMVTEGWSPFDSFYMTITILATVGGGEATPLSTAGRLFTAAYIVVGVGTTLYILTALVVFVVEGQLGKAWEIRRMEREISNLRDHFIICGYGRVGRQIVQEFSREGVPAVVIDINQDSLTQARSDGQLTIAGTPAADEVLQRARIATARGLIAAMDSDPENIYVTLSARVLRPDLFIVARANRTDSEAKLQRAGANRVISPYRVGGRQMALLALRPLSVDLVDTVLAGLNMQLILEDVAVKPGSRLIGLSLTELRRTYLPEALILALKRGESVQFGPSEETCIAEGDVLAVIGTPVQLERLEAVA